jgi:hypothetical protein
MKPQIKIRKNAPTIVVDGVRYKIPAFLLDAPDEEIIRVIRGWFNKKERN